MIVLREKSSGVVVHVEVEREETARWVGIAKETEWAGEQSFWKRLWELQPDDNTPAS